MTLNLTFDEFDEQCKEADEAQLQWDPLDRLDVAYSINTSFCQGWKREVDLSEGLRLYFYSHQTREPWIVTTQEREVDDIDCIFASSGKRNLLNTGEYQLEGSGILPGGISRHIGVGLHSLLFVEIQLKKLYSFVASSERELPRDLQHLVKPPGEPLYLRSENTQPKMTSVLQQICRCPYQSMIKRAYLESKAIELIALVLDREITIQQGEVKRYALKPEQLERVRYAKEVLLRDISHPPSLTELTQTVGLNAFTLEQHFRQVFGNTVFGELQARRLEVAKQLLAEQDISISTVAQRVGYASAASFTKAFKRRFGITPRAHQKICR